MSKKLSGAKFFIWLGEQDRKNKLSPAALKSKWPEWANTAYMYGYWLSPIHNSAPLILNSGIRSITR